MQKGISLYVTQLRGKKEQREEYTPLDMVEASKPSMYNLLCITSMLHGRTYKHGRRKTLNKGGLSTFLSNEKKKGLSHKEM